MRKLLWILPVAALCLLLTGHAALSEKPEEKKAADRSFTSVNIEYKGTKVWVPSTFIVQKGETVEIKLVNNTPSGKHGFALDAFGVQEEIFNDAPKTVTFTASKEGLFPIYCHLHTAHIGGQLLVLSH